MNFSKFIENRIANIKSADAFAFAFAIGLGPWLVPLGPAIVFGYALYKSAPTDMADFRIVTAVAVAIGLIVAGAVSSHNAITAPGLKSWSLVIGYIFLEIAGLWLMTVALDIKVVGTVASLLTLIIYLSRSSAKAIDTAKVETRQADQDKLDFQIEQARLNAEHKRALANQAGDLKHAENLAQIEQARLDTEHERAMASRAADMKHTEKLAQIEAKVSRVSVPKVSHPSVSKVSRDETLETIKAEIITELGQEKPNMTQLAGRLDIGRGTLYRHLATLAGTGEVIKNGNGYELPMR